MNTSSNSIKLDTVLYHIFKIIFAHHLTLSIYRFSNTLLAQELDGSIVQDVNLNDNHIAYKFPESECKSLYLQFRVFAKILLDKLDNQFKNIYNNYRLEYNLNFHSINDRMNLDPTFEELIDVQIDELNNELNDEQNDELNDEQNDELNNELNDEQNDEQNNELNNESRNYSFYNNLYSIPRPIYHFQNLINSYQLNLKEWNNTLFNSIGPRELRIKFIKRIVKLVRSYLLFNQVELLKILKDKNGIPFISRSNKSTIYSIDSNSFDFMKLMPDDIVLDTNKFRNNYSFPNEYDNDSHLLNYKHDLNYNFNNNEYPISRIILELEVKDFDKIYSREDFEEYLYQEKIKNQTLFDQFEIESDSEVYKLSKEDLIISNRKKLEEILEAEGLFFMKFPDSFIEKNIERETIGVLKFEPNVSKKYYHRNNINTSIIESYNGEISHIPVDIWILILEYFPLKTQKDLSDIFHIIMTCKDTMESCKCISISISGESDNPNMIRFKCRFFNVDELKHTSTEHAETFIEYGVPQDVKKISWWSIGTINMNRYYKIISKFNNLEHLGPCFNRLKLVKDEIDNSNLNLPQVKSIFMSFSYNDYIQNTITFWNDLIYNSHTTLETVRMHYPPDQIIQSLKNCNHLKDFFIIPNSNRLIDSTKYLLYQLKQLRSLTIKSCNFDSSLIDLLNDLSVWEDLESLNISLISSVQNLISTKGFPPKLKQLGLYRLYFEPPPNLESLIIFIHKFLDQEKWEYFKNIDDLKMLTIVMESGYYIEFTNYLNEYASKLPKLLTVHFIIEHAFRLENLNQIFSQVQTLSIRPSVFVNSIPGYAVFVLLHIFPNATLYIDPKQVLFDSLEMELYSFKPLKKILLDHWKIADNLIKQNSKLSLIQALNNLYTVASTEFYPKPVKIICELYYFFKGAIKRPQYFQHLNQLKDCPTILLD